MSTFSLRDTLESGQIFRWRYDKDGAWVCHANKLFFIDAQGNVQGVDEDWARSFLRSDQQSLEHEHPYVKKAISETQGIRVLRQDPWECLVAFIISQNNHQKRIMTNVQAVAAYGKPLGEGFHAFPQPRELPDEHELRTLGLGYRAKHIAALRDVDLSWLHGLRDKTYEDAQKELMTLSGIGPKVADCILLFGLGFDEACPEDTWIKKIFLQHKLTRSDLGPQAGLVQQHLFHYARTNKN